MFLLAPIAQQIALGGIAVLLGLVALQTGRLHWAQQELLELQVAAERAQRETEVRIEHEKRLKEKADHELAEANHRIAELTKRLRDAPVRRSFVPTAPAPARSGDPNLACFDRRKLDAELAAVARRHAERLSRSAEASERIAAALRSCAEYSKSLHR